MDASEETPISLKAALAYLLARHGLHFTVGTMHVYCATGRGPRHRKNGRLQFLRSDLDAWVLERSIRARVRRDVRRMKQTELATCDAFHLNRLPSGDRLLTLFTFKNLEPFIRAKLASRK